MHFRAYLHDISRYSHFNAQKHETTRQNIRGTFAMSSPTKLFGGHVPRHPVSEAVVTSSVVSGWPVERSSVTFSYNWTCALSYTADVAYGRLSNFSYVESAQSNIYYNKWCVLSQFNLQINTQVRDNREHSHVRYACHFFSKSTLTFSHRFTRATLCSLRPVWAPGL